MRRGSRTESQKYTHVRVKGVGKKGENEQQERWRGGCFHVLTVVSHAVMNGSHFKQRKKKQPHFKSSLSHVVSG